MVAMMTATRAMDEVQLQLQQHDMIQGTVVKAIGCTHSWNEEADEHSGGYWTPRYTTATSTSTSTNAIGVDHKDSSDAVNNKDSSNSSVSGTIYEDATTRSAALLQLNGWVNICEARLKAYTIGDKQMSDELYAITGWLCGHIDALHMAKTPFR
jgi:hypothetical protein